MKMANEEYFEETGYYYMDSDNHPVYLRAKSPEELQNLIKTNEKYFKIFELLIATKSFQFYNVNKKLINSIRNVDGETALDLAIKYHNVEALVYILDNCNFNPNIMNCLTRESIFMRFFNSLELDCENQEQYSADLQILSQLLSHFALSFDNDTFYKKNEQSSTRTPEENHHYFMLDQTISDLYDVMYDLTMLYKDANDNDKPQYYAGLKMMAEFGFLPNCETFCDDSDAMRDVITLFLSTNNSDSDKKFSKNLAEIMQVYNRAYIEEYSYYLENKIIEMNIMARTLTEDYYSKVKEADDEFEAIIPIINTVLDKNYTFETLTDEEIDSVLTILKNDEASMNIEPAYRHILIVGIENYLQSLVDLVPTLPDCTVIKSSDFEELLDPNIFRPGIELLRNNNESYNTFISEINNLKFYESMVQLLYVRDALFSKIIEKNSNEASKQ